MYSQYSEGSLLPAQVFSCPKVVALCRVYFVLYSNGISIELPTSIPLMCSNGVSLLTTFSLAAGSSTVESMVKMGPRFRPVICRTGVPILPFKLLLISQLQSTVESECVSEILTMLHFYTVSRWMVRSVVLCRQNQAARLYHRRLGTGHFSRNLRFNIQHDTEKAKEASKR